MATMHFFVPEAYRHAVKAGESEAALKARIADYVREALCARNHPDAALPIDDAVVDVTYAMYAQLLAVEAGPA
jgi:hypothetical protein